MTQITTLKNSIDIRENKMDKAKLKRVPSLLDVEHSRAGSGSVHNCLHQMYKFLRLFTRVEDGVFDLAIIS
jgi:hypothetical protein